ncbi:hypothetical protein [Haloarchaeobius sp. HME9146]|uniref:hypothetical protein n=1 Tax=Haloarchaeobius sp. HME9146 TaxID=2978732 RepID=UPI0021BFC4BB|nr:hypothetical protein [Haloarchaeobius sp. HME9146]MCT9096026.1 hypothetical protein [Haloarchaeobius sp. HME9146]
MAGGHDYRQLKRDTEPDSVATLFLWVKGAAIGAFAFIVGLSLVHFLVKMRYYGEAALAVTEFGRWRVSSWVYYNAHLVPTDGVTFGPAEAFAEGGNTLGLLAAANSRLLGLYLLPPALLVVAGYVTAKRRPKNTSWVRAGLAVFVGYFFVAVVFMLVSTLQAPTGVPGLESLGTQEVGPNPWFAIAFAAIAYPAFFGMLGATIGRRAPWRRRGKDRQQKHRT